ncbi:MAG: hypothetical protein GF315_01270 [candidate division Zixibacteria bacterium]|nr:hypothetical protein [candidate division Zixibacteria bacterium]
MEGTWGEDANELPSNPDISGNFPNPFNPSTDIIFRMPQESSVRLEVYNIMGQKIELLADRYMNAGRHD